MFEIGSKPLIHNLVKNERSRFVIIGNIKGWRVEPFQASLKKKNLKPALLISYEDLMKKKIILKNVIKRDDIVKIESPEMNFKIEKSFLAKGTPYIKDTSYKLTKKQISNLKYDLGRIYPNIQWYNGFRDVLININDQLKQCESHFILNPIKDILIMFDKKKCHKIFSQSNLPVPRSIDNITSYEDLIINMEKKNIKRVFIKSRYGSSASGLIAFRKSEDKQQAITTMEMIEKRKEIIFYNSKKIRTYNSPTDISTLINFLCKYGVHVEEWIPKAGLNNHSIDLRVVMIAGQPKHTVVRMNKAPMTNLHLSDKKGDFSKFLELYGETKWKRAKITCQQAIKCFPNCFYAGIDLLINSNFSNHYIIEINAFGDLLLNSFYFGKDVYTTEIEFAIGGIS